MLIRKPTNTNSFWGTKKLGTNLNTLNLKVNNRLAIKPLVGQVKAEAKQSAIFTQGSVRSYQNGNFNIIGNPQPGDKIIYKGKIYEITHVSHGCICTVKECEMVKPEDLNPNRGDMH